MKEYRKHYPWLRNTKSYQAIAIITRYMDRYYIDPVIGIVLPGGLGDLVSAIASLPYIYFSVFKIKSITLTLAVVFNILRDILIGMIPFFVGDVFDVFSKSYHKNMQLIDGFIDGDERTIWKIRKNIAWIVIFTIIFFALIYVMFQLVIPAIRNLI